MTPWGVACIDPMNTVGRINFIKRRTIHCYIHHMEALGLVASEKNFFLCFSYCKAMEANDPRGGAFFDSRSMIGRIYVMLHITMLHTKY